MHNNCYTDILSILKTRLRKYSNFREDTKQSEEQYLEHYYVTDVYYEFTFGRLTKITNKKENYYSLIIYRFSPICKMAKYQ